MFLKKKLCILIMLSIIFSLVCLPAGAAYASNPNATISGRITLPAGTVAPAGGVSGGITIKLNGSNINGIDFSIPEGNSSAVYSLTVPVNAAGSGYTVNYWVGGTGYVGRGFYSKSGTVMDSNSASIVDVSGGDASGIDLTLIAGNIVSGTIYLLGGAPAGGLSGWLGVNNGAEGSSFNFSIPEAGISEDYSVTVPVNATGSRYTVNCFLFNGGSGYVENVYYSVGGTVTDEKLASLVDISAGDAPGIDITFPTGNNISGTMSLPGSMTAPAGGLLVWIMVTPQNGGNLYQYRRLNIPEGGSSADYSVTVPANDAGSGYWVNYWLPGDSGYYSTRGTVMDPSLASLVDVSSGNASGINLTMLTAISTPSPTVAPSPLLFAPTINSITDVAKTISGKAASGGIVTVTIGTKTLTSNVTSGVWKVTFTSVLSAGTKVSATVKLNGVTSVAKSIYVIPATPVVSTLKANSIVVKGTATKGSTVYAKIGTKTYTVKASTKTGAFSIKIPKIKKGTSVVVTCKAGGQTSASKTVKAV
jgi:hypothetical protein